MHTSSYRGTTYRVQTPSIYMPQSNLNKPKRNGKKPYVIKKKRDNEHLQIWLKTRQLLSDDFHYNPDTNNDATNKYDQQLLESTKQTIIHSFGTFNDILNVFIQNGNKQQLSNIYDILKNLRLNNQPISLNNDNNIQSTQQTENIQTKYHGFIHLSSAEICCITDYLPKYTVNKFKLCSRKIGIVCLQQMNKMTIGVYNMNKLIYHKQKDLFLLNTAKFMSFNRYTSNINHSMMFDLWNKYYNIPTERQLICTYISSEELPTFTATTFANYPSISDSKISSIQPQSINKNQYLLFDTLNMIMLTPNSAINMFDYTKQNIIKDTANFKLLILKYFDIFGQTMEICNFIFIHKATTFQTLFDYIENKFIIHHNHQRWYTKFKIESHELNVFNSATDDSKFLICQENKNEIFTERSNETVFSHMRSHILIFQFNPNHSYIKRKAKEQEQTTLNKVYRNNSDFISDYKKINMSFTDNNKGSFANVLSYLSNQQQNTNINIHTQLKNFHKNFSFSIGETWTFGLLRKKICGELNSVLQNQSISYRNIDLFQEPQSPVHAYGYNPYDNCRFNRIYDSQVVKYKKRGWKWNLVPYNSLVSNVNECVYEINIHLSHPSVNAVQYEAKHVSYPIYLRYNKVFKVKDFVSYIHKHINDVYSNNGNFRWILPLLSLNNNVLTAFECCYGMNDTFSKSYGNLKVCHLNFYIMQHNGINKLDKKKPYTLKIRFVPGYPSHVSKGSSYATAVNALCGIPYFVSFDRNSNLQSIINGIGFNQWIKWNINCSYKFGRDRKIIVVSRKSGSYEHINVYDTFVKNNDNDILIIKLKKGLNEYR